MTSNRYVQEDGKVYKIVSGISSDKLPEFSYDEGKLKYKYSNSQLDYSNYDFIVDENGFLITQHNSLQVLDTGYLSSEIKYILVTDSGVTQRRQKDIDLLRSHNKQVKMKVTLLDNYYNEVDNLVGNIKGYPSYDINSESDIRRACALTLSIPAKDQVHLDFEKTWIKRMVKLSCGLYDWGKSNYADNDGYIWYELGVMLLSNGYSTYDATTQEVKLNLVDLMATLTEERGSQFGETYFIPVDSNTKTALEDLIVDVGMFNDTDVCEFDEAYQTIPYDLYSDQGDYPIDILKMIINLFPYYEFFYDIEGKFVVQKIPTEESDLVSIGKDIIDEMLIREKKTVDFSSVKNTTEIWGRSLSGDYVITDCKARGNTYVATIDDTFEVLESGKRFTFSAPSDSIANQQLQIQNTPAYGIYNVNGAGTEYTPISAGELKADTAYVVRYFDEKYVLMGPLQIRVIVQEVTEMPSPNTQDIYKAMHGCDDVQWVVNPESPFACTINPSTLNIEGEIRQVLSGGEYENIYTTQLAFERASYENYLKCRLQDTVELDMVLIPWMDVNTKIEYTSPIDGIANTWLVKAISYDFSNWTMTVKASRFYPQYPWH